MAATPATTPRPPSSASQDEREAGSSNCRVAIMRSEGAVGADAALVRCSLRGELPRDGPKRHKVLAVALDRSGSMAGSMWRRVVEAVVGVVTDALLEDPHVSIALVVYNDQAQEVRLPRKAAELQEMLLSRDYAPQGGTSFKAAFELTWRVLKRELNRQVSAGASPQSVDLATLVFTDGEDTSVKGPAGQYGVRLVDKDASAMAARAAGDRFREALRGTGCSTYLCVAAFGADHSPDQCQYLSDRYYYINRGEVLAEVLAGGLGALLSSAGQCSLRLHLPPGATLEEPLPESLPLDACGCLDHHVWLRMEDSCNGVLRVDVEVGGAVVLQGDVELKATAAIAEDSFDQHLFLVDLVALQLRRVARELCGGRPSSDELASLRVRLTDAKDRLQPTKAAATAAAAQVRGRAALRERLAEVEAARERLSYALGQFDESDTNDERKIGSVAIDAILRDAGQHVPQGPAAAALARRADLAAELPAPEQLSKYGSDFTLDGFSCCNAQELASQGDALFFQLGGVRPAPGGGFLAVEEGDELISYETFMLLSRNGKQGVKCPGTDEVFTHLGLPLYATPGHFLRASLLLPDVLQQLSCDGVYRPGATERQLLSLLGRSLARGPARSERQAVALLHKARAMRAVLSAARSDGGGSLLAEAVGEASRFTEDAAVRSAASDLYAVAAAGMLAEDWPAARLAELADRLCEEALRRRVAHSLRGAGDAQRLCLAWSLLGGAGGSDAWLDLELPCPDAGELRLDARGFDPFTAPEELEALEREFPGRWAPRAAGAAALVASVSGRRSESGPPPAEWGALRQQLGAWASVARSAGGVEGIWATLDALITDDAVEHQRALDSLVAALRGPAQPKSLRAAFPDSDRVAAVAVEVCLPEQLGEQPLRCEVAGALRAAVERRSTLVRRYPITGADFPKLEPHSAETVHEIWGAPAEPLDPALHHKAMLRVWRRTMNARVTTTIKEALADKEYRKRGGRFAFPSPLDTFIRGLHRRTADLHRDWTERLHRETSGSEARRAAVAEMLLRLRWDDRCDGARAKLSQIVGRIWDGLEGVDLAGRPLLSSALWLDDGLAAEEAEAEAGVPEQAAVAGAASEDCPLEAAAAPRPEEPEAARGQDEPVEERREAEGLQAVPGLDEPAAERRPARNGWAYTRGEFLEYYGEERGATMWDEADACTGEAAEVEEVVDEAGARAARAEAARQKMAEDAGLRVALEGLDADLRRRMDTFAADQRPGSRMKLPTTVSAKQRKAVHIWAEAEGLEHQSFGYRGRRRLHLSVTEAAQEAQAAADAEEWEAEDSEAEEYDAEGYELC